MNWPGDRLHRPAGNSRNLASTFITAGLTWLVLGGIGLSIPFMHATLFGALVSPTDPIAVMAIMRSVGAPQAA